MELTLNQPNIQQQPVLGKMEKREIKEYIEKTWKEIALIEKGDARPSVPLKARRINPNHQKGAKSTFITTQNKKSKAPTTANEKSPRNTQKSPQPSKKQNSRSNSSSIFCVYRIFY